MKLASIEKVISVYPHPDPEVSRIEYVKVLGYDCLVQKGQFQVDELVVLIQPDNILPDDEWAKIYKAKSSRVKAIRLKKAWSFGVVESLSILPKDTEIIEGKEVSEILGIFHYEPPVPQNLNAKHAYLPYQLPKTDEERANNIDLLQYEGQYVDITLKIDGSSCLSEETIIITEDGKKTIKDICENKYSGKVLSYNIKENKEEMKEINNHFIMNNNNDWYEIELENGEILKLTGNHRVYLPGLNCYRQAKELSIDDIFYIKD